MHRSGPHRIIWLGPTSENISLNNLWKFHACITNLNNSSFFWSITAGLLVQPSLIQNRLSLQSCHLRHWRLSVADVKFPCDNNLRFLRNTAVHIVKFIAWTCNKIRQPETTSNVSTRSSILVLPQTENITGKKISGFEKNCSHYKTLWIQSSHFRFQI